MRTSLKTLLIIALALTFSTNINAQRNNNSGQRGQQFDRQEFMQRSPDFKGVQHQRMIAKLNLTEAQQEQFQQHWVNGQKEMLPLRNELREKNARLTTLTTGGNYDEQAVSALVEEIGELRTQMLASRIAHRQELRTMLTEEQQVIFDTMNRGGAGAGKRMQRGYKR